MLCMDVFSVDRKTKRACSNVIWICFSLPRSIKEPVQFWGEFAKEFYWETPAMEDKFFSYNFDLSKGDIFIRWMEGASTNISFNLLDKNVKSGNGDKIAFYW